MLLRKRQSPDVRSLVAWVASISNGVIVKVGARAKKGNGRDRGEEETLACKPHDSGNTP